MPGSARGVFRTLRSAAPEKGQLLTSVAFAFLFLAGIIVFLTQGGLRSNASISGRGIESTKAPAAGGA